MKQSIRNPFLATLALASLAFVSVSAHAADQVWNNSGATPDWNTADDNWGEPPTKWLQGNHAIFGGNGETVTLTEGISAGGITFTAGGYTITGNTLTLADGATITTAESVTAIINSALGGSGAIAKSGGGTLTLGGANGSYTGAVTVAAGRLQLNSTGALGVANAITLGAADGPANPAIAILAGVPDSAAFGALTVPASVTGAGISLPQNSATRSYSFAGATLNSPLNISQSNAAFPNWSQLAFTSKITGPGAGSGNDTLVLGNTSGMQTYFTTASGVAHDFSGNIRVLAGLIAVQSGNAGGNAIVPDTAMITINSGATWRWNGGTFTETVDGLAGAGAIGVNAASYNLTIHANNPDNEGRRVFAGSMANPAGTLILGGTGTQEFSGGNPNFSAGTSLNNGTLRLTNTINWNSAITFGATDSPKLQLNAPAPGDLWTFAKQVAGGSANASIEKTGDGKVTVTDGGSSFAGKLLVQAGTLAINATVGDATAADGTTLEGGAGGSGSLTAGAVTLGAATTDKVTLVGTLSTNPAYRAFTVNNLTIHGGDQSVTLDAGGAGLVSGTAYDLLVSANPITAPNASSVLAAFKSNSRAYAPVLAAGNTKVQLFYDANAALYWVGTTGAWNTTSTLDWKLTGNNAFTEFRANDTVFFRDNPVSAEVEIADADVTPLATVFENTTATDYAVYG
nr:autotransporter-associated beta strand repeat-containing protein [Akkermansiaceae bacterium]